MRTFILRLSLFVFILSSGLHAQEIEVTTIKENTTNSIGVGLNTPVTSVMMEPNQNLRKAELLIDAKSAGLIYDNSLSLGFSIIGIADYQNTNSGSKFAYLMRHPTSANQIGDEASEIVIHSAQLSLVSSLNSWLTVYGELLYSPEQSFGTGTINSLGRNQIEFRKGIVMIGNLEKLPLYLAIGKLDTPFGQMRSVSPFTNSTMWHAFGGLAYGAIAGFKKYGINIAIAPLQGGSQFRAANVPVDSTAVPSRVSNIVLDFNYTLTAIPDVSVKAGISYIKGTAYCHNWPVVHFEPCDEPNSAVTYYGEIIYKNRLVLKGSFAKTRDVWPGTFNPNPPLNVYEASRVSSLDYGAKFNINPRGKIVYTVSGEFSNFISGAEGSPWERQNQLVFGVNAQVEKHSRIFLEYFRTTGYVPLNFISGGNFENPGVTHSDRNSKSFGFVLGVLYAI